MCQLAKSLVSVTTYFIASLDSVLFFFKQQCFYMYKHLNAMRVRVHHSKLKALIHEFF